MLLSTRLGAFRFAKRLFSIFFLAVVMALMILPANVGSWSSAQPNLVVVSAASYATGAAAPESIATAFGTKLATTTATATDVDPNTPGIQLPTSLGGTSVKIGEALAPLFYVSPGQVNFLVPANALPADLRNHRSAIVLVQVISGDGTISNGSVNITPAVPGIFTIDGTGGGVPAGYLVRVRRDGSQAFDSLTEPGDPQNRIKPIDFGPEGEKVFLILFATGIRNTDDPNKDGNVNENIRVNFNGYEVTPSYAGRQLNFPGLDQINVEIPRSLLGFQNLTIKATATIQISTTGRMDEPGLPFNLTSNQAETRLTIPPIGNPVWRPIGISDKEVFSLAANDLWVFAGTNQGIFRSSDNGGHWEEGRYMPINFHLKTRALVALKGGSLNAGTDSSGVYFSSNDGEAWIPLAAAHDPLLINKRVLSLTAIENVVFVGSEDAGVFRRGFNWESASAGLTNLKITALVSDGSRVYAGTPGGGVFVSTDAGTSWQAIHQGLPADVEVRSLAVNGSLLLAGTSSGLYRSRDSGASWSLINQGLPAKPPVSALLRYSDKFFAGTMGSGAYVSNDQGINWQAINTGLYTMDILSLFGRENQLRAGTPLGAFSLRMIPESNQPPVANSMSVTAQEDELPTIFLTGSDPDNNPITYIIRDQPQHGRLLGIPPILSYKPDTNFFGQDQFTFRTSDGKITSRLATVKITISGVNDPPKIEITGNTEVRVGEVVHFEILVSDPDTPRVELTAENLPPGARFSSSEYDTSFSWIANATGIYDVRFIAKDGIDRVTKTVRIKVADNREKGAWVSFPTPSSVGKVAQLLVEGTTLYINTDKGLFRSIDGGATWQGTNFPVGFRVPTIVRIGSDLLVNTFQRLYRSTDNGMNWTEVELPPGERRDSVIAASGGNLIVGTESDLYLSPDKGASWKKITNGLPFPEMGFLIISTLLATQGSTIFAALKPIGVFRSTDDGATWVAVNTGLPKELEIEHLLASGDKLYLLSKSELFSSTDQGNQWTRLNLLPKPPGLFTTGTRLVLGNGVIGCGPYKLGVYLSRDDGQTFLPISLGLTDPSVYSLAFVGSNLFALTIDGLFIRPVQ